MSCPEPLQERQNEEKKDDTVLSSEVPSENRINFKTKTTLGSLHYLISECAGILEDAEELVQQCYYDRKGLLEIPTLNSQEILIQFINTTVPHWYVSIKDEPDFKRIVSFTKQFAKEGKILAALNFLFMLKKEYAILFTNGSTSFSELKGCYEKTARFQRELTARLVFLGVETDALILWVGENQETIKVSENIAMPDLADFEESLDCNSKSIQAFIEDLNFFCNDLKQRLIKNILVNIDDTGRSLNLCPPYDPTAQNRGVLLLEAYSRNPALKEKLNYLASHCEVKVSAELEELEKTFQAVVTSAKTIDSSLGTIKRISYLSQALDPRIDFAPGFCAGDSRNWCHNRLNEHEVQSQDGHLIEDFNFRRELHSEVLTDSIFWLQMKSGLGRHEESIFVGEVSTGISDVESAKNFCVEILDLLQKETLQNTVAMAFEVILNKKQSSETAHQISFCRFFRNEMEVWRVRDLNCGEFEGNFPDLKEWYSKFYAISLYVTSFQYDTAVLKKTILVPQKINTSTCDDEQYRSDIQKNMSILFRYSLFSEDLSKEILMLHQRIICPTIKDNNIKNLMLFLDCQDWVFSNPNKAFSELGLILSQVLEFEDVKCQTVKCMIWFGQLVALFNASQFNEFEKNFSQVLSSIEPSLLKSEDAMFVKFVREQYFKALSFGSILTDKNLLEYTEKIKKIMEDFEGNLEKTRTTIETRLTELISTDLHNRGTLKRLCALLDCYVKKCVFTIFDSEMFDNSMQFVMTGLQEERMHPSVEGAMETFLNELSQDQIPQPLTFMRTLQSEIYNQKWIPEDKGQNQLSERKKHRHRYCPGIVDTL